MTIKELVDISGDSYLENYSYENGIVTLMLDLDELDKKILIRIKTGLMAFNVPDSKDQPYRTCFFELKRLSDILQLKNGIFVASEEFGKFMQEKRENLNLAYGLKAIDNQYIFSLSASSKLASFIIKKLEDIDYEYTEK